MASGVHGGTSGVPPRSGLARAYMAIAGLVAVIDTVNVLSSVYDARRMGRALPAWEPITWESTSGVAMLASCGMVWLALTAAPPGTAPWRRLLPMHALALLAFSALHTGLMTLFRIPVYALKGRQYGLPPFGDWIYEFRKDVAAYLVLSAVFWIFCRPDRSLPGHAQPTAAAGPETFDIVDGPSIFRTPVREILAVRAAGNYVEFVLEGGARPLMRAALADIEAALSPQGFVRTHRSWLVNATGLRRIEAAGSGDYRLVLANGAEASLSRRFPQALDRLKGP
jgi:hypothetical protein